MRKMHENATADHTGADLSFGDRVKRMPTPMPLRSLALAILLAVSATLHAADPLEAKVGKLAQAKPDDPMRIELVKVQIALDRALFRPGKIDGLGGEFTQKAADRYCLAYQMEPGTRIDTSNINPYRDYTITEVDAKWIGNMASQPQEQEKLKRLPYRDMIFF